MFLGKSSQYNGCDTFCNTFNRFDPASPIRFYTTEDDPGVSGGSKSGTENGGDETTKPETQEARKAAITSAVRETIADLLGKNGGDKDSTLETLVKRNYNLETQLQTAKNGSLSKDDREAFAEFKALNLSVDDVKRIAGEHSVWSQERVKTVRTDGLCKAAKAPKTGLDADLLVSLDGALGVEYLTKGTGDDETGYVKFKEGDKEVEKPLSEWAAEKWPSLKDRLSAGEDLIAKDEKPTFQGRRYIEQGGGPAKAKSIVETRLAARAKEREEKSNPLISKPFKK